ncbi:MAG: 3-keto-5-aminohexanoate cleavage protein [Alphaproteobacteria bacterium]
MSSTASSPLPPIMVAPNGARKVKADHPQVPLDAGEIAAVARDCADAGAGAIHYHVRDADGGHILDAGLYHEAIAELQRAVPEMHLQMTTETVGKYQPGDMRDIVRAVVPQGASVGVREMIPDGVPKPEDIAFYNWTLEAGIQLQHICYGPEDVALLAKLLDVTELERQGIWCLFVIGHYTGRISYPGLLPPFLAELKQAGIDSDWAICAFATEEAACLRAAIAAGGKVRVGFENSVYMADGSIASDNAARVREAASFMAGV